MAKYNISNIMRDAWELTKRNPHWQKNTRFNFKYNLQLAWIKAKCEANTPPKLSSLEAEIITLENRTRLGWNEQERLSRLERQLREEQVA